MLKISGDKWMLVKFLSAVLAFTIFPVGAVNGGEGVNGFIDYVAIYNQESQPANYREKDNAAAYYQKAIKASVSAVQEIGEDYWRKIGEDYWRIWPGDFSKQNLQIIRRWIKHNSSALSYFTQASKKPYFWTDNKSSNGSMLNILLPDLSGIRRLTQLTCCRAMLEAMDGDISNAAKDIETIYRVGNHFGWRRQTVEQLVGVSVKASAVRTVLMIIQNTQIDKKEREYLYNSLKKYIDDEKFTPDLLAMKLKYLDCLQRMYTTNKNGEKEINKQSSQIQYQLLRLRCTSSVFCDYGLTKRLYKPKSVKMNYEKAAELIAEKLNRLEKWMALDAWQLNEIINQKDGILQKIQDLHPLLYISVIEALTVKLSAYERLHAQSLALDVTMSVLTFKENTGRLPLNLNELQEAEVLMKIPIDPFSGKPIVYKKLDGDFTVYSYGLDFDDDGGVRRVNHDVHNGDIVVWPVEKYKEPTPRQ